MHNASHPTLLLNNRMGESFRIRIGAHPCWYMWHNKCIWISLFSILCYLTTTAVFTAISVGVKSYVNEGFKQSAEANFSFFSCQLTSMAVNKAARFQKWKLQGYLYVVAKMGIGRMHADNGKNSPYLRVIKCSRSC